MTLTVNVGTPPPPPSCWSSPQTVNVQFHGFVDLSHQNNAVTESPPFFCHGHKFTFMLYPGGDSQAENGNVSVYLKYLPRRPSDTATVKYTVKVEKTSGEQLRNWHADSFNTQTNSSWGFRDFLERDSIIADALRGGTLTISLSIQVNGPAISCMGDWAPKQHAARQRQLFHGGAQADVKFRIQGQSIPAHRAILVAHAPVLFDLVAGLAHRDELALRDVDSADLFRLLLEYIYTEDGSIISGGMDLDDAKALLELANRFGVCGLKLYMEELLKDNHLQDDTAAELLMFAEAKSCHCLYEACFLHITANLDSLMNHMTWPELENSKKFLVDMTKFLAQGKSISTEERSFGQLYSELAEEGDLHIQDGPRDMLAARLEEIKGQNSET